MAKDRLPELTQGSIDNFQSNCSLQIQLEQPTIDGLLNQYGEIRTLLATISNNLDTMAKMVQSTNFRNVQEPEMDSLRNQNLKFGFELMKMFKDLQEQLPDESDFTLEARMKRTLFYGLHQKYINLWSQNELFLQSYENKMKKNLELHSRIVNCNSTEEELEELIASKKTSLFVDNILEDIENERNSLRNLMKRFSELKKLEKSIEDVHNLFLRIQNLVVEQNERIQVVEYHAQQASVRVDKGADQLDKAHNLKKSTLKKKVLLFIILAVVLAVIILLLFVM